MLRHLTTVYPKYFSIYLLSVHDLHNLNPAKFDTAHTINHFSFGTSFPGKSYPMDGRVFDEKKGEY